MGFVLATVFLHGVGIAGSLIGRQGMRLAGMGIAAAGLALILGV
jgi:hydrogenase/urease accessory protein HupE